MKEDKIGGIEKYKVESDLRTLRDYEEIKSDDKRLSAVKILHGKEMDALGRIAKSVGNLGSNPHGMEY